MSVQKIKISNQYRAFSTGCFMKNFLKTSRSENLLKILPVHQDGMKTLVIA